LRAEGTSSPLSQDTVTKFINVQTGIIGRTASTLADPQTSGTFHFWLARPIAEQGIVEIGTIVGVLADDGYDITFGTVDEMRTFSGAGDFAQDYRMHRGGDPYTQVDDDNPDVVVATCKTLSSLSGHARPTNRGRAYFPTQLGLRFAFGLADEDGKSTCKGAAVPIGVFENGDGTMMPIAIDENFIVGPEAAHVNVSGISGLAAKTSALQFFLKSMLWHSRKNIAAVVINVKSKDLLYIDQLNTHLQDDHASQRIYQELDIPIEPFVNARFFAPAKPNQKSATQSLRQLPTEAFSWDLRMMYEDIPTLFSEQDWEEGIEGAWLTIREEIEKGKIETYLDMLSWIDKLLASAGLTAWPKGYSTSTWQKIKAHLRRFTQLYRGLLETHEDGLDIPWRRLRHESVFVIDIEMLSDGGQKLVFGRVLRAITNILETNQNELDAVVLFVDELNKFAPGGAERTPLKSHLIEVTARGRSLGLVLFGAEQFASSVDKQVVENSATYMFGRTEASELHSTNYANLSNEVKAKLTLLKQGQLFVKYPKFPKPIFMKFPFPPALPGDDFVETEIVKPIGSRTMATSLRDA